MQFSNQWTKPGYWRRDFRLIQGSAYIVVKFDFWADNDDACCVVNQSLTFIVLSHW